MCHSSLRSKLAHFQCTFPLPKFSRIPGFFLVGIPDPGILNFDRDYPHYTEYSDIRDRSHISITSSTYILGEGVLEKMTKDDGGGEGGVRAR